MAASKDGHRLPTDVRPTHYDLVVRTDLEKEVFQGIVKISLDVTTETSTLVFNTTDLDLIDASLSSDALGSVQTPTSQSFAAEWEEGTLSFARALPAGSKAQLRIAFAGKLTGALLGYYKSEFTENDGMKGIYTLTQFQPSAARRAFPCWDEPALKATYSVSMISRAHLVSLANMSAASEGPFDPAAEAAKDENVAKLFSVMSPADQQAPGEWKITRFDTTPPISSYIVAYANGPFKCLESSYKSPLSGKVRPLRVYTTSEIVHQAKHALEITEKVLPIYEEVFDIEYPLPKLDTLAAHDFDMGAMENWGLITGRTNCYLMDPEKIQLSMLKRIVVTQSHEIAHMWFGNITTMEWWDNLYLNEGFATFMGEYIIVARLYPEWKVDSEFLTTDLASALILDAKPSSHPIEVPCPDVNQVNQIFDGLSYAKAASVLRMLCNYVGQERFIKGVSIYLKEHLYSNTVTKDLWDGIQTATGTDIPKMMDNWVKKIGFPVITVTENKDSITVRQDRFLETGHAEAKDNETIWTVPLALLTVDESGKPHVDNTVVLDTREKTIPLDTSKPYKLNASTYGVYRVLYPEERLFNLTKEAAKGEEIFSLNDRIGLVHDAFALAKAGFLTVSAALTAVDNLRNDQASYVWDSISLNLQILSSTWWENPKVLEPLNKLRASLFGPIVQKLGFDNGPNDDPSTIQLRSTAVEQAAASGETSVVEELKKRFARYMESGDDSGIPADIMRPTLLAGVRHGGRKEFEFVKKVHAGAATPPATTLSAMLALCQVQDTQLVEEVLEYMRTTVRDQDLMYFFRGLQSNNATRRRAAEFLKAHFDEVSDRFPASYKIQDIVSMTFRNLTKDEDYAVIVDFFKDKDRSKYNMAYDQMLDSVRASNAWIKRSTADVEQWLADWSRRSS
ncbi:hypothetical protein CONPUDRAFT_81582 [Coniophora puteana RWD-64-598 SS2]|uniref:Aminopeptidase n=1 Tax=Coniophora puteana (strain RWD-64-598) TaxID=741705 RepID=A0A5M3MS10_CONPW|nr:uncharacterized protein CONPUDRAFT_81582 [Coniophora puteana RWD-64-598 SS2]EIW81938.1 hypothetical protein CONPUDRAFT_81582 [Coniophora puteana RWD-64-598 SS2]